MLTTKISESCLFLNATSSSPTWDECYAIRTEEWTAKETGPKDPKPKPDENVCSDLNRGESKGSVPSSPLQRSPRSPVPSTATSRSPFSDRTVRLFPRSGRRWRSPSPAVRVRSRSAGGSKHGSDTRPGRSSRSERFMSRYEPRSYSKEGRYATKSEQHLPAAIRPSHWYQAIGRRLCVDCEARGWVQNTSWMCVNCKAPLCLVPYRNCFSRWHTRRY